jgi:aspartate ammonia-lyase
LATTRALNNFAVSSHRIQQLFYTSYAEIKKAAALTNQPTSGPGPMPGSLPRRSAGLAALHNEELGFLGAAELAKEAVETGKTIDELVAKR